MIGYEIFNLLTGLQEAEEARAATFKEHGSSCSGSRTSPDSLGPQRGCTNAQFNEVGS